ncbi:uncharacterized protein [Watersipora subatra]|uniref:uncharacterized protein n=1 Tax=Watersipora subatra TaxID=2589382 RepID=UPI00355C30DB
MEKFDELPKADIKTEDVVPSTSLPCDCHECDEQVAVCYCVDCALKMCDAHQQAHSLLAGEKHQTIPISTYQLHPGIYKKALCEQHGGEVLEVCDNCSCTACLRCDRSEESCEESPCGHTFTSLNTLKKKINAEFDNLLEQASEKLTELCILDKQIWNVLDEEEVECAKRIQMIERIRDEQIEMIREESEKLKEQIYEYQRGLTDQVELYNTELMAKKERLEESCSEVRKWLRESHVTEKVEQRQQMTDELVNNTDVKVDCPLTRTPALIHSSNQLLQQPKLVATPTSLTFISEHSTNSGCYSAAYAGNDKLFLGCGDGVKCLNKGASEEIKLTARVINLLVTSVRVYNNIVYILHDNGNERTVYQCLSEVSKREKLFSFNYLGKAASEAAVGKDYIVAINPDEGKLVLYNFTTKLTMILTPSIRPFDLHFLPDGDLLTLSVSSNNLIRCRIEDDQLTTIWTCEGLDEACTVTSDIDGFIYVSSRIKTIYIISPEGDMMKEISNNNLPDFCGQISIRGRKELAVPTWGGKSVCLFKVNHY